MATAKQQVADKIALEESLKPKLRAFFNQLNDDVELVWAATGKLPDFNEYRADLIAILRNHYRKVGDEFGYLMQEEINQKIRQKLAMLDAYEPEEMDDIATEQDRVSEIVLLALLLYISTNSIRQAEIILETVMKQYEEIVTKIITERSLAGESTDKKEVAEEMHEEFDKQQDGKIDMIAVVETEQTAEKSKLLEAAAIAGSAVLLGILFGEGVNLASITKTWNTIMDGRERPHHHDANGQTVGIDEPFIVNGERLKYPGDQSLGATASNIINCRCTATYSAG